MTNNAYRPKFNKRDKEKDIFIMNKYGQLGDVYSSMENWRPFRRIKGFEDVKQVNKLSRKENLIFNTLAIVATIAGVYLYSLFK